MIVVIGWTQRYNLQDWWRLRGYTPPAAIAKLADDTSMTDYGRKLFYVNHPELDEAADFNQKCSASEQSIVLGCYVNNQGIYLYNVQDERLAGVHQVTAAHEMLHAAYERLDGPEKARIDQLTADVLAASTDARLKETIDAYRQRDASVVPNELHSIVGTEVASVPTELETYYKKYFKDRQVVVSYSDRYESAFQERKDKVTQYDQQLKALKAEIDRLEASLDTQAKSLTSQRAELEALADAKRYEEYNARVPGFNNGVKSYNASVTSIRTKIERYNQLVNERNAIALEENELVQAIDSRPDTIPTQ
jgi:hypothetical protein